MLRFFALPAWQLLSDDEVKQGAPATAPEQPLAPGVGDVDLALVLGNAEYRGDRAWERALRCLELGGGARGVYARPPGDLPALLRTADQLVRFTRQDAGERALVWRCDCGARYAVPHSLLRPVAIRCDVCDRTVDLDPARGLDEPASIDPEGTRVNDARRALAEFFREAMFRGWPVLVAPA